MWKVVPIRPLTLFEKTKLNCIVIVVFYSEPNQNQSRTQFQVDGIQPDLCGSVDEVELCNVLHCCCEKLFSTVFVNSTFFSDNYVNEQEPNVSNWIITYFMHEL